MPVPPRFYRRALTTTFAVLSLSSLHGQAMPAHASLPPPAAPPMQAVLDELAGLEPKPIETLTPKQARKEPTPADAVMKLLQRTDQPTAPEKVADVNNRAIDGPGGDIAIRIYTPAGAGPFPVIVYYHGGGFVIADLDTYDATPRALANAAQAVVVSSHYRQGPEHKFPAAHDDAYAAYEWTLKNASKIKGDPSRIAVAGESAGGNLAVSVAMMAKQKGAQLPVHQLLVYPVVAGDLNTPSYRENANAKPLNRAMMAWFFQHAATPADAKDPRLSPLNAPDLSGLPPTTIITAEIDPLRSEGEAFAGKLREAGVKVSHQNFAGVTHEFFGMGAVVPAAKEAVAFAAQDLRASFGATRNLSMR